MEDSYRGPQVCAIVGITYRQLDYWTRTNLIRPSVADAKGSGTQRRYSYRDLLELRVIKNLLDGGVALQSARRAIEYLRDHLGEDVATANLVINGAHSISVQTGEEIVDLLRHGQGVLNIVPLSGVKGEVDAALHLLRQPEADKASVTGTSPVTESTPAVSAAL